MERILDYAQKRNYTKYTSTLKEAWRLSISGLSKSLVELLKTRSEDIIVENKDDLLDDIVKKADKALYQAKTQGRNRVIIL